MDVNLEIDLNSLPPKYKSLKKLKDKIRELLNQIIADKDFFSDGQDSTSVISVGTAIIKSAYFNFDLFIFFKNSDNNICICL